MKSYTINQKTIENNEVTFSPVLTVKTLADARNSMKLLQPNGYWRTSRVYIAGKGEWVIGGNPR